MQQVEQFNRHMMAVARDSRGLTQTDLAKAMGVGQGTISKYESGIKEPPKEFVADLANVLKYLPEFFVETGRPYGMPPFHYRRRKKLGQKALSKIVAEMNIRRLHLQVLLKAYPDRDNGFIPEIDRDEYSGGKPKSFSVQEVARQLREMWLLPDGPIENVTQLIEDNGGVVIPCNFDSDLIDAVSQRIDGLPILFFINMNAPADRIRHTLCHELGHMLLHTTTFLDDDVMEREADRFAGAFLMPEKAFRSQLRRFDFRQVANMKKYWKVAMSSIVMRADSLNLITPYQKKSFFIQLSKLGYRKNEPYEPSKEYPNKIRRLIDYHLNALGYSMAELATALYITKDEFERMYGAHMFGPSPNRSGAKSHLRVIK